MLVVSRAILYKARDTREGGGGEGGKLKKEGKKTTAKAWNHGSTSAETMDTLKPPNKLNLTHVSKQTAPFGLCSTYTSKVGL